jgi:sulfite reductase alpha subunit-like flavoprotein
VHHAAHSPSAVVTFPACQGSGAPAADQHGCACLPAQDLQAWHDAGIITLHTAFSRMPDQPKVYVQQRLRESAAQVWQLLEAGGHFYVCGDAGSMAGAVQLTLLDIIEQHQGQGPDAARQYLEALSGQERYQRDVWFS